MSKLVITQTKSVIGKNKKQIATMKALGLRRIGCTVEKEDTAAIRGMIGKVSHCVKVEER